MTAVDYITAAREYLGTPFHHQGRVRGVGIDCVGLVVCSCWNVGIPVHDCTTYPRVPDGTLLQHFQDEPEFVPVDDAIEPGDLLLFWIRQPGVPCHVGIRTDVGVLHTYEHVGRVVEHGLSEWWSKRIHSVWRAKQLWQL